MGGKDVLCLDLAKPTVSAVEVGLGRIGTNHLWR